MPAGTANTFGRLTALFTIIEEVGRKYLLAQPLLQISRKRAQISHPCLDCPFSITFTAQSLLISEVPLKPSNGSNAGFVICASFQGFEKCEYPFLISPRIKSELLTAKAVILSIQIA